MVAFRTRIETRNDYGFGASFRQIIGSLVMNDLRCLSLTQKQSLR
jgi:hypothetical protein